MKQVLRLVVVGTVGAGKSTFVRTVNGMGLVQTDRIATDEVAQRKSTTTVAFDFCHFELNSLQTLHIYGSPGQYRFHFIWDWLIQKADGFLLLVAAHRPEDFEQTRQIQTFIYDRSSLPVVIGLTHTDCPTALSLPEVITALNMNHSFQLSLIVNPCDRSSVLATLSSITTVLWSRS